MDHMTVCVAYCESPEMLRRQQAIWTAVPGLSAIVVDDGSRGQPARDCPTLPGVRLLTINQWIAWNNPGARNLAFHVSTAPWLLFLDIDHYLDTDGYRAVAALLADALPGLGVFEQRRDESGLPLGVPPNIFAIHRDCWVWYDEDFAGNYGSEDHHFLQRYRAFGFPMFSMPVPLRVWRNVETPGVRDPRPNRDLLKQKGGSFNPDVLRFQWAEEVAA